MRRAPKSMWTVRAAILLLSMASGLSLAHTMAPILITVAELSETEFAAVWSFSRDVGAVDPARVSLEIPPHCGSLGSGLVIAADNRWIREEVYECARDSTMPLVVAINGLDSVGLSAALRLVDSEQNEHVLLLDEDSDTVSLAPDIGGSRASFQYLFLGWQHIFEGIDHVLFVIALCFLGRGSTRKLIALITAFTVAHSVTLSAATLGWVKIPARPVEALIAFSIALVAADLVRNSRLTQSQITGYWPVVFVFGLLHGLGFAGALEEIGLPQAAKLTALLAFNVGVELGQICLVLCTAILIAVMAKLRDPRWMNAPVGFGIGCVAGFWFISRVV